MTTFTYRRSLTGTYFPIINLRLYHQNTFVNALALVDSGASISMFRPSVALALGIDITKGKEVSLDGVGGGIKGYLHTLSLVIADKKINAPIIFSLQFNTSFNLIGRDGVFEQFAITFDEKNKKITFA